MADIPQNHFKRGLHDGRRQPGFWLTLESANVTEIVAGAGYDWMLLDMEHTTLGIAAVADHVRAARGGTAELMVRVPWNDPVLVKRLLDAGVRSLMFPYIQDAREAVLAVAATRYPPQGIRGFSGNSRATNFARITDYAAHAHQEICVVVQVETPQAIANIAAIGAVDGVDAIFVGPNDLAANMGLLGQSGALDVRTAVRAALDDIRATGKAPGMLEFNIAEARKLFDAGYTFVAVGSDTSIIARRSEALLVELQAPPTDAARLV